MIVLVIFSHLIEDVSYEGKFSTYMELDFEIFYSLWGSIFFENV